MQATLTRPTPKAAHGVARWQGARPTADLLDCGIGLLEITPTQADGRPGTAVCYWVRSVADDAGKVIGYEVTREDGARYVVDLSFGGWDHASCDCPGANWRPSRTCKHIQALRAALAAVGL